MNDNLPRNPAHPSYRSEEKPAFHRFIAQISTRSSYASLRTFAAQLISRGIRNQDAYHSATVALIPKAPVSLLPLLATHAIPSTFDAGLVIASSTTLCGAL